MGRNDRPLGVDRVISSKKRQMRLRNGCGAFVSRGRPKEKHITRRGGCDCETVDRSTSETLLFVVALPAHLGPGQQQQQDPFVGRIRCSGICLVACSELDHHAMDAMGQ